MPQTKPLIGIIGHARAGKDTAARYLIDNHDYKRLALDDALREAALALDPLIPGEDTCHRLSSYVETMGWEQAKSVPEIRRTLQRLRIMETDDAPYVITDIRQPHELEWLRARGGHPLGIRRDRNNGLDADNSQHSSEVCVDEMLDSVVTVDNNGTVADLHELIEAFYRKICVLEQPTPAATRDDEAFAIARLDPRLPYPYRAHADDAGIDLYSAEDFDLAPGHRKLAGTGVAVRLPSGTVGLIHPRSGLAHKKGVSIVNSPGTVDAGYRGEVKINLINLDPTETVTITRGERIAQLVLQDVRLDEPIEISPDELTDTARGTGGHGSTGN